MEKDELRLDSGRKCVVALYDDAVEGSIAMINNAGIVGGHSAKVGSVMLRHDRNKLIDLAMVLSVSYKDCMRLGYDKVKESIVSEHGRVLIEAHAYSAPEGNKLYKYHKQFEKYMSDPRLNSFVICSPGHTKNQMRFPATVKGVHSIGLVTSEGQIIGSGAQEVLQPTFLMRDEAFLSEGKHGDLQEFRGTSAAVGYVAALAAQAYGSLSCREDPINSIFAALVLISQKIGKSYLIKDERLLINTLRVLPLTPFATRRRELNVIFTKENTQDARIVVVAHHANTYKNWVSRPVLVSISVDNVILIGEEKSAVVHFDELLPGQQAFITIALEGLCDNVSVIASGGMIELISENADLTKKPGDLVIVGVSASHDASVCVMINQKIVAAIQLERLSRVKRDGAPFLNCDEAINYCLKAAGLNTLDVDYFAYNIQSLTPEYVGLSQPVARGLNSFDPFAENSIFTSHHLCHAFAGLSGSGYASPTVVVADGSGGVTVGADDLILTGPQLFDYLSNGLGENNRPLLHTFSVYEFTSDGYTLSHREYSPSFNTRSGSKSIGETYASVSQYVFGSWQASGKLMGLAPYGDPLVEGLLVSKDEIGVYNYDFKWKFDVSEAVAEDKYMNYANLAASVQYGLELALKSRFALYVNKKSEVVFTGGIALNSVANHKIRKDLGFDDFYLFPAQHDAGVSIGAAVSAYFYVTGKVVSTAFDADYLGYIYSREDVVRALNKYSGLVVFKKITSGEIAAKLAAGDVLGYFSLEKGSEFGPRALGARSILADPRSLKTWLFINRWVKFREDFRPFAPMVARDYLSKYFDCDGSFPYMLEVVSVREEYRNQLLAITHVDGTARVQTVDKGVSESLHDLLLNFMDASGFPILLNTSFNVRGQPIVETPCQAIEMLLSTHLSGLVMGDYLVEMGHGGQISLQDILSFSPGTKIVAETSLTGTIRKIIVSSQGKQTQLPSYLFQTLEALDGEKNVASLTKEVTENLIAPLLETLGRFVRLKYLNAVKG